MDWGLLILRPGLFLYHVNSHGGFHELIKNNYFLIIMCYKFIAGNPEMIEKSKKEKTNI